VLVKEDVVATPIQQLSAGRLFVRSFDPAGGGSTNWAILISNDSAKAAVCYSTDAVYGDGGSTWYYEGEVAFTLEGSCPSEADEIENSFGTWPIGAIPG